MKKITSFIFFILVLCSLLQAQGEKLNFQLSRVLNYHTNTFEGISDGLKGYQLGVEGILSKKFSLVLNFIRYPEVSTIYGFGSSDIYKATVVHLDGRYHFLKKRRFTPYLLLGVGYYFEKYEYNDINFQGSFTSEDIYEWIGINYGAGLSVKIIRQLSLFAQGKYVVDLEYASFPHSLIMTNLGLSLRLK